MARIVLPLTILLFVGCPTTDAPPSAPGAAGGQPSPTSPGEPGGQPGGVSHAADGSVAPPPGPASTAGAPGSALGPGDPIVTAPPANSAPGFASLIQGGPTVTISGTLIGASDAQVDFTRGKEKDGRMVPEPIEILKVTGGRFKIDAPATLYGEFWVTAMTLAVDGTPFGKAGVAAAPIRLEGKDVSLTISLSDSLDWMKVLPWHQADMPKPGAPLDPGAGALPTPPNAPP